MNEIKLSGIDEVLRDQNYPVDMNTLMNQIGETTVLFADGDTNLGDILAELSEDSFDSPESLEEEIYSHLPVEAIGEPRQSEGDA